MHSDTAYRLIFKLHDETGNPVAHCLLPYKFIVFANGNGIGNGIGGCGARCNTESRQQTLQPGTPINTHPVSLDGQSGTLSSSADPHTTKRFDPPPYPPPVPSGFNFTSVYSSIFPSAKHTKSELAELDSRPATLPSSAAPPYPPPVLSGPKSTSVYSSIFPGATRTKAELDSQPVTYSRRLVLTPLDGPNPPLYPPPALSGSKFTSTYSSVSPYEEGSRSLAVSPRRVTETP